MPNGTAKNWIRFCGAINGFRLRYGKWPNQVLVDNLIYESLMSLFKPKTRSILQSRVELIISKGATVVAIDDQGNKYNYGNEGFPKEELDIKADDWLGVSPDR